MELTLPSPRWLPLADDVTALALAFIVGGIATEATDVASSAYADVNDIVGIGACSALLARRRWPIAITLLTVAAGAAAPLAGAQRSSAC